MKIWMKLLALVVCLAACVPALGEGVEGQTGPGVRQMTTITYDADGETALFTTTRGYGKNGLVLSMLADEGGEEETVFFSFGYDDKGSPERLSFSTGERAVELRIENTYEGDALTAATLTEVLVDGEPSLESLLERMEGVNSAIASTLTEVVNILQGFVGYRDAELSIAGYDGFCMRFEGGRIVLRKAPMPGYNAVEEWTYAGDDRVTQHTRWTRTEDGQETLFFDHTYEYGPHNIPLRQSVVTPDSSGEIVFRYEDSVDPATGAPMRLGYVDAETGEIEGLGDVSGPLVYVYMDADGQVTRTRVSDGMNETIYDFDARGRTLRQETRVDGKLRTVNAWTYDS